MQLGQPYPMMAPGFSGSFSGGFPGSPHMMAPQPFMQPQFQPSFGHPMPISPAHGHHIAISPTSVGGPMMMPPGGPPLAIPPNMQQFSGPPVVSSPQSPGPGALVASSPPLQPFSHSEGDMKKVPPAQLSAPVRAAPPPPPRDTQEDIHSSKDSALEMDKALHHSYSSLPDTYSSGQQFDPYSDSAQDGSTNFNYSTQNELIQEAFEPKQEPVDTRSAVPYNPQENYNWHPKFKPPSLESVQPLASAPPPAPAQPAMQMYSPPQRSYDPPAQVYTPPARPYDPPPPQAQQQPRDIYAAPAPEVQPRSYAPPSIDYQENIRSQMAYSESPRSQIRYTDVRSSGPVYARASQIESPRQKQSDFLLDVNLAPRTSTHTLRSSMQESRFERFEPDQRFSAAAKVVYGGRKVGLGMLLEKNSGDQSSYISQLVPGCAAHRSELQVGDLVLTIDGIAISSCSLEQVRELCIGEEGSSSVVEVIRNNRSIRTRLQRTMPYQL